MNQIVKQNLIKIILNNWHIAVAFVTAIYMVSKALDMNTNQSLEIQQLQSQVLELVQKNHEHDIEIAILKQKLLDLKEYK